MSERNLSLIQVLEPAPWPEYELIDSGNGKKLERFGQYRLERPDTQAIWSPALPAEEWAAADAVFRKRQSDDGPGDWSRKRSLPEQWPLHHDNLAFWLRLTPFRHTGIFPEHSAHWPWLRSLLASRPGARVLVLFGYTGLMTLYAAGLGAHVCHVDASKPAVRWAQENQAFSGLAECPVRWIIDDVGRFVAREIRRGRQYDLVMLDPPVFGRGPRGEIWRLAEGLPGLLDMCAQLLSEQPLGVLVNAYATNVSSLTLGNVLGSSLTDRAGQTTAGEMVLTDRAQRPLSAALYARWSMFESKIGTAEDNRPCPVSTS
jgi:23S rRNA (cytosine1962-C5)-methyltransferase